MTKDLTSIIIVNYNTKELTRDCIHSVMHHFTPQAYEIIVVDNQSADGSVDFLRQLFPNIRIIANEKNLGFGTANNIGVSKAVGEFIFLLNSDTIVTYNILEKFIAFYRQNQQLKPGVLGSLLLSPDKAVVHSFGNFPAPLGSTIKGNKTEAFVFGKIESNYYAAVDIVVGANMFMETAVFNSFAGFDNNIFLYEEELELQYRMQKSGYMAMVLNEKGIIHLEGKSSASYFKRKCSFISLCYIYKKHLPYWLYVFCRIKMMVYALLFFKNPKTTWQEKLNYLKLSILKR